MAPEPETLKRKRSRPSDWWAATPSTTDPQEQDPSNQKAKRRPQENKNAHSPKEVISEERPLEQTSETAGTPKALRTLERESSTRKRSRPSDWWAVTPPALPQDDKPTSKKQYTPDTNAPKRTFKEATLAVNRGVPLDRSVKAKADGNPGAEDKRLKRRAKSNEGAKSREQEQNSRGNIPLIEKKRGRPPRRPIPDSQTHEHAPTKHSEEQRGTKRSRRSAVGIKEQAARSPLPENKSTQVEISGVDEVVDVQTASSALARTRPRAERVVKSSVDGNKDPSNPQKRKGPSSSAASSQPTQKAPRPKSQKLERSTVAEVRNSVDKADELRSAKRRRVQETSQEQVDSGQEAETPPTYQHLAAVTRRVPRHTIEAKWEPLPPSCVEHVSQLLADLQKPVVVRHKDENKRTQASTALQMISRRLVSKILKGLPFPPGTNRQREDDFNFEKLIDRNRALNSQLTAVIDANKLLDSSLSNEIAMLQAEEAALSELETNAKAEARKRKQVERKLHPLLQSESAETDDGIGDNESVGILSHSVSPTLSVFEDESMQAIIHELEGHVDSMDGNLKQVQGLTEAMAKTKAAVQVVLFDHIDRTRSEEVVLGAG